MHFVVHYKKKNYSVFWVDIKHKTVPLNNLYISFAFHSFFVSYQPYSFVVGFVGPPLSVNHIKLVSVPELFYDSKDDVGEVSKHVFCDLYKHVELCCTYLSSFKYAFIISFNISKY